MGPLYSTGSFSSVLLQDINTSNKQSGTASVASSFDMIDKRVRLVKTTLDEPLVIEVESKVDLEIGFFQ
jgi:hypothetical protein